MMHRALTVPASMDLRPLLALLRERSIPAHITEESGKLVVWAHSPVEAEFIEACFQAWQQGQLEPLAEAAPETVSLPVKGILQNLINASWTAPVTVLVLAASLLVAVLSDMGADPMAVRYLFFPNLDSPTVVLSDPRVWLQMLTPALLHFGAIHLVFNSLWLWYFGRMMEPVLRSLIYAGVLLWLALAGNLAQYLWSGMSNFGGLSGVVYGQIGFIWMWQTMRPGSALRLPVPMIMVFLVALIAMEVLASAFIASAAHAGGLLGGMLAGVLLGRVLKRRS